jgi:hypothetical protein
MTTPWVALLGGVANIIDDLVTTEEERGKLALENRKIDAGLQQGQIDTNKVEAAHPSLFVAGWRPAAGWVAAISLGMVYIPKAAVMTAIWAHQAYMVTHSWSGVGTPPAIPLFPDLGVTDLIGLLLALLGLAGVRSFDKVKEVQTERVG